MITVSGNTYNYRETLRDMGGTFDETRKIWVFPDSLPPHRIEYLKKMVGVIVTTSAESLMDRVDRTVTTRFMHSGKPNIYGDDQSYLNTVFEQNPRCYFGFSNLEALTRYIEAIPESVQQSRRRSAAWETDMPDWRGTRSMSEAIDTARNGWKSGVEQASEILELLESEHAQRRQRLHSVAGGRVNVGRLLSGEPKHMQRRAKQPGKRIITLYVDCGMLADVRGETAILRSACVAAIVDLLEQKQFSCEIVTAINTHDHDSRSASQLIVTVKHAGEKLNLNDLVFMLGHPSLQRRFHFALKGSADELHDIWSTMGATEDIIPDARKLKPNEFFIPHATGRLQRSIRGDTLLERAQLMLHAILPAGLPLTLEYDE